MMAELRRLKRFVPAYLCLLAGCGGGFQTEHTLVPAGGVVTLDGEPLAGARLEFTPLYAATAHTRGSGAFGVSNEAGRFELFFHAGNAAGTTPGKYRVEISKLVGRDGSHLPAEADIPEMDLLAQGATQIVPPQYRGPQSTLEVSIPQQGDESLQIDLFTK